MHQCLYAMLFFNNRCFLAIIGQGYFLQNELLGATFNRDYCGIFSFVETLSTGRIGTGLGFDVS